MNTSACTDHNRNPLLCSQGREKTERRARAGGKGRRGKAERTRETDKEKEKPQSSKKRNAKKRTYYHLFPLAPPRKMHESLTSAREERSRE